MDEVGTIPVDESSFEVLDLENVCRTCLGKISVCKNFADSITTSSGNEMKLLDILLTCANIQASLSNDVSQNLCETCCDAMMRSYMFRLKCKRSEMFLLNALNKRKLQNGICESDNEKEEITRFDTEDGKEILAFICKACNKSFSDKNKLLNHTKGHGSMFSCKKCDLKFCDFIDLKKHKEQHLKTYSHDDDVKRRTCGQCGKVFQYRTSMLKHQKKHSAPPKTCKFCDFKPLSPGQLAKHMEQTHSGLKTITCHICNKAFFQEANLRLHMVVHSGVKKHVCEICGMTFALGGNLSAHIRLHTGEKPYTCSQCGKGFTQQSALRSHEAGHSNRRDHACLECGAAFSRVGALRNHSKRHSGNKPFECSMCSRTFTFSSERKRHMTIHTGDKNFVCEICGRCFNRTTNLKVHMRIHTGETPYVCDVCGKGFIQAHCLGTHMNTHLQ